MERSDNRALEQAERAFDAVGVNLSTHPFVGGMIHRFVCGVVVRDATICGVVIGVDVLRVWMCRLLDEAMQRRAVGALASGQPNVSTALNGCEHHRLVALGAWWTTGGW